MNAEEQARWESEARRLGRDTLSLKAGMGVRITNEEALIVVRALGKVIEATNNETMAENIGSMDDFRLFAALYMRLATAMSETKEEGSPKAPQSP